MKSLCILVVLIAVIVAVNGAKFPKKVLKPEASSMGPSSWSYGGALSPFGLTDVASNGENFVFTTSVYGGDKAAIRSFFSASMNGTYNETTWGYGGISEEVSFTNTPQIIYASHLNMYVTYVTVEVRDRYFIETVVAASPDASNWTVVHQIKGFYNNIFYLNNTVILAPFGYIEEDVEANIFYSTNLTTWQSQTIPVPFNGDFLFQPRFTYWNGSFIMTGFTDEFYDGNFSVYFTQDFQNWDSYGFETGIPVDVAVAPNGQLIAQVIAKEIDYEFNSTVDFYYFNTTYDTFIMTGSIYAPAYLKGVNYEEPNLPPMAVNNASGVVLVLGSFLTKNFTSFTAVDPTTAGIQSRANSDLDAFTNVRAIGGYFFFFLSPNITSYSTDGRNWTLLAGGVPATPESFYLADSFTYWNNTFVQAIAFEDAYLNYTLQFVYTQDGRNFTYGAQYAVDGVEFTWVQIDPFSGLILAGPSANGSIYYGFDPEELTQIDLTQLPRTGNGKVLSVTIDHCIIGGDLGLVYFYAFIEFENFRSQDSPIFAPIETIGNASTWRVSQEQEISYSVGAHANGSFYLIQTEVVRDRYIYNLIQTNGSAGSWNKIPFGNDYICKDEEYETLLYGANNTLVAYCAGTGYVLSNGSLVEAFKVYEGRDWEASLSALDYINYNGTRMYSFVSTNLPTIDDEESYLVSKVFYSETGLNGTWINGTLPAIPERWNLIYTGFASTYDGSKLIANGYAATSESTDLQAYFIAN